MEDKIKELFINVFAFETRFKTKEVTKKDKLEFIESMSGHLFQINYIQPNEHVQSALRKLYSYCPSDSPIDNDFISIQQDIKAAIKELLPKK